MKWLEIELECGTTYEYNCLKSKKNVFKLWKENNCQGSVSSHKSFDSHPDPDDLENKVMVTIL